MEPPLPRILVIDDEPRVGTMLVRLLRRSYDAVAVTSAEEAWPRILAESWDAILCDVRMPGTSGLELYARLLEEAPDAARVTGFMTGGVTDPDARAFLEAHAPEGWLAKPFRREDVISFVERLRKRATP